MRPSSPALRFLAENAIWLMGSLLLAVFIWVAAVNSHNPVESRRYPERIPIRVVVDEGMIVTNIPVATAQLVLRASTGVWQNLALQDIQITADLTGKPPGVYTVPMKVTFATGDRIVVEDIQPQELTVAIDQAAERLIPVVDDIRTPPSTGLEVRNITFDPPEVLASGTASQVARVASATVRLHLGNERNTFTRNFRLFAVDSQGQPITEVTLSPDTVDVAVEIEPGADYREVFIVPDVVGEPADGYVVYSITYDPQSILVSGLPDDLEHLPGTIQTSPIDLTGQTQSFSTEVTLDLPAGVFLPAGQDITVTVQIETLTASRRFDNLPVEIQGLGEGLQAAITPNIVSMLITGPQPILDTLSSSQIAIVADLTGLDVGTHQVLLQAVIGRQGLQSAIISVLPPMPEVVISAVVPEASPTASTPPAPTPRAS